MTHENRFAFQGQIGVPAEEWGWLRQRSRFDKQSGFPCRDALAGRHIYMRMCIERCFMCRDIFECTKVLTGI